MSKNRKKLFHWANIPDGVKSESSFWGQISINLNPSLRLDWDLWFIILFLRANSPWKWLPEMKIFTLAPNQPKDISLDRVYIVNKANFSLKLGYFFWYIWISNLPMENSFTNNLLLHPQPPLFKNKIVYFFACKQIICLTK